MVDCSSSTRSVSIRFRLATELVVLIGKMFPCRGKLCRIEAGLTRATLKGLAISSCCLVDTRYILLNFFNTTVAGVLH